MANPIYHDDPEFYERPGETVHLQVDPHPAQFLMPGLPWQPKEDPPSRQAHLVALGMAVAWPGAPCLVCGKAAKGSERLCDYCARAQQRDETHRARARQPQPSQPRIAIREGWEVWATANAGPRSGDPENLESGHVRAYETRIG